MKVEDYYPQGKRWWWLRLHEKGGMSHEVPCHHTLEEYLDAYREAARLWDHKKRIDYDHEHGHRSAEHVRQLAGNTPSGVPADDAATAVTTS